MPHDGMPHAAGTSDIPSPHPSWCDPEECTVTPDNPWGWHHSPVQIVKATPPIDAIMVLYLTSPFLRFTQSPLLGLEIHTCTPDSVDADVYPHVLTLDQARQLYTSLAHLLAADAT